MPTPRLGLPFVAQGQAQLQKLILGVKFAVGLEVAAKTIRQPETAAV